MCARPLQHSIDALSVDDLLDGLVIPALLAGVAVVALDADVLSLKGPTVELHQQTDSSDVGGDMGLRVVLDGAQVEG